jgi:hypothetical protein
MYAIDNAYMTLHVEVVHVKIYPQQFLMIKRLFEVDVSDTFLLKYCSFDV